MAVRENKSNEPGLEQMFVRIDEILKSMEDPTTSLEESFALFEEGMKLTKEANNRIDMVEKQVKILQQGDRRQAPEATLDTSQWVE